MKPILIMALAEIQESIRNRWIVASILLLLVLATSLTLLGSTPVGITKASLLSVTMVSLTSLSIYLIPLIALMLSFDSIVGESERGTLLLLLTYPIRRWQIIVGKFFGHLSILTIAILLGYGIVALYFVFEDIGNTQEWLDYVLMMASSLLLGGVFIALGYLVSVIVQQRATATGISLALWLFIVVFYDLILLGLLLADKAHVIQSKLLAILILFNPADVYRLFNLTGSETAALVSGMSGMTQADLLAPATLLITLTLWILIPLTLSIYIFNKREV
ncbi:MAG: ABC transporter permease [Proteobacteria bacterium]|nr:ABC transporter permease [Pseudomonadota bacterium]NOG59677.1 ABC transporter permease [Pseudomonadota bacterium]